MLMEVYKISAAVYLGAFLGGVLFPGSSVAVRLREGLEWTLVNLAPGETDINEMKTWLSGTLDSDWSLNCF